jgi:hypothetical protein
MSAGGGNHKDGLAEWLVLERERWADYHHHKERMAWLATALALAGAAAVLTVDINDFQGSAWHGWAGTVAVLAIYWLVFSFLRMQFRNRWRAADYSWAFKRAHTEWLRDNLKSRVGGNQEDRGLAPAVTFPGSPAAYPQFLVDILRQICEETPLSLSDDRLKSELASYAAVGLAAAAVVFRIWHWHPDGLALWVLVSVVVVLPLGLMIFDPRIQPSRNPNPVTRSRRLTSRSRSRRARSSASGSMAGG